VKVDERSREKPLIGQPRFLAALTVYKATADVARGGLMFEEQSSVPDAMLPWRSTVIAFKQPRRQLVQPITRFEAGNVVLQEFEASAAGLCASYAARYAPSSALRPLFDSLLDVYQL
jgi:hypothetical protein